MVAGVRPRVTLAEFDTFIHLAENRDHNYEYVGGEIYQVVSNPVSSKIAARISGFFFVYLQAHDVGHLTGADGGYIVSGERYIPDVAFIRYKKQPALSCTDGYVPTAPDLAVEVLSPGNEDEKMRIKISNYLAAGTVVWVVDIEAQVVEVYVPGQPVQILSDGDMLKAETLLPGFELAVRDIFPQEPEA
jgi:Uma2 family endonuclease